MEKIIGAFVLFLGAIGVLALLSFIMSWPVMVLWNDVVPVVFGLKVITWMQAWELTLLSSILMGSTNSSSSKKE